MARSVLRNGRKHYGSIWIKFVVETPQSLRDASCHGCLEEIAQQLSHAEPTMAVLQKRRMIRYPVGQIETAKPPLGQVQMILFAESPLGADAKAIAH